MKIRSKIILVFLPLLITTLILSQLVSYYTAITGVTRIAQQLLNFKAQELKKYADNQWNLLVENNYAHREDMVAAAQEAIAAYARTILLSNTELILAVNARGELRMATSHIEITEAERVALASLVAKEEWGIEQASIGGETRVFTAVHFTPFGWYFILSETEQIYYQDAARIAFHTLLIILAVSLLGGSLLFLFSQHLTVPLQRVISAMERIISSGDLSERVALEYPDETGKLANTFNLMIGELDAAYLQIKKHAFESVLAGKKEQRIRQIFQKYVPKEVIDQFFAAPETMLIGENRPLAILFSDIRSFTAISEAMAPEELVSTLNRYFSDQVDIIMNRNGIVDKYIGDAIMAFWGAPVRHEDDPLQSVLAALDMIDAVALFNAQQKEQGKPTFKIGLGINYGIVTVGNIGSERKMDYTVIGDPVNLASRMEGLTKKYLADLLITEYLYDAIRDYAQAQRANSASLMPPARQLDTVTVVGKTQGVKVYAIKRRVEAPEAAAWESYHAGMELYYARDFARAEKLFAETKALLPGDFCADLLMRRCHAYRLKEPPVDWDGAEIMETK